MRGHPGGRAPGAPLVAAPAAGAQAAGGTPAPATGSGAGPSIGGFNPVTPMRLLDTRPTAKVGAGCVVSVDVSSVAPVGAAGIALNVTTTEAVARGFVTAYPCGSARPPTSNVNPRVGDPTPNLVIVPARHHPHRLPLHVRRHQPDRRRHRLVRRRRRPLPRAAPVRALDTRIILLPDTATASCPPGPCAPIPLAGSARARRGLGRRRQHHRHRARGGGLRHRLSVRHAATAHARRSTSCPARTAPTSRWSASAPAACCASSPSSRDPSRRGRRRLVRHRRRWRAAAAHHRRPASSTAATAPAAGTAPCAPAEMRVLDPTANAAVPAGAHDLLLNVVATQAAAPGLPHRLSVQAGPAA